MKIVDMHCDTISRLFDLKGQGREEGLRENTGHLDLLRMRRAGYLLQNFALFVEMKTGEDPWEKVCSLHEIYRAQMEENADLIAPVLRFQDIADNEAAGKLSALLTVEEGGVCKGELAKLKQLCDWDVRMLTLTWNFPNELGEPNRCKEESAKRDFHTPNLTGGLTERGREFVAEMEKLGMIPDVSHLSDAGFYDVLAVSRKPFVASHSNARTVCPHVRNMTDDMIRKLSERGGVMGLNYCAYFMEEVPAGERNPGSIEAAVRHAAHVVNVGGIQVLGLGSDFDGIDTNEALPGAESMERLWDALKAAGFQESNLDLIFGGNVLRVYRETLM